MYFSGYPKETLDFLAALRNNNTKEWFIAHKHTYDAVVLEPSRAFVVEMGEHLQALVPTINALPKINGSLFRIYRDTRFSKDKTPMKSRIGIIFWQGKGRRLHSSSFYLHFSPDELFFAVGIRNFSQQMRDTYRQYLLEENHRSQLHAILQTLEAKGYAYAPAHYKRLPKGFTKEMPYATLALLNGIYAYENVSPERYLFTEALVDKAYQVYEDLFAPQQWVYEMTLKADL